MTATAQAGFALHVVSRSVETIETACGLVRIIVEVETDPSERVAQNAAVEVAAMAAGAAARTALIASYSADPAWKPSHDRL